jgi:hypothetical protein
MSFLSKSRAAIVGAFAAAAIVAAPSAWAGQVNFRGVIDSNETNSTISNTLNETISSTISNTIAETTSTVKEAVNPGSVSATLTFGTTISNTINETVASTIADTINETVSSTILDGVVFTSQPADVSVELTQGTVNSSSPYNNSIVDAGQIDNVVDISDTSGITQVNAAAGQANVQVSANSIVDGGVLVALAAFNSSVGNKELGHALVCAGCGMQNSNISYIEQIVGVAESAAEVSSETNLGTDDISVDELTGLTTTMNANIVTAIAINQGDVSEFSPHDNTINGTAVPFLNDVLVSTTSGITQVNAAAGQSNVQNSYNNISYAADAFVGPDPF